MPNVPVTFSGDASGVAAAAAAAQAAIDSVHGKTETVTINVKVNGARDAAAALDQHAAAAGRAASGARDHASASERASNAVFSHADASERASAATRDHASASNDASRSLDRHTQSSERAGAGMERLGRDADLASGGLGGFARSGDDANRSTTGLGRSLGDLGDSADGAGRSVGGLTRGFGSLTELSSGINVLGAASSTVRALGLGAAFSAAGSGILTAAVGALGVAGVGALTGVGVAAGLAGGAMASFTADAQKDSAKFGNTFKQMGGQAHLGAQYISEPFADAMVTMGRSLVNANNQMTPAGMSIANSLRDGFSTAADTITQNSGAIVGAAAEAAGGFARLTGDAAPGVSAFLGQMPALTNGAVSGMSQITQEFGRSAGAIEGATPALNRMMGAAGGLGAELVSIGARSVVPFAEDMTSMTQATTRMANQLEPAIKPSMSAFSDLFGAAAGGIGGLTPGISEFADTVSRNGPQMESIVGSIGRGMLSLGSAAVDGLGQASPAISQFSDALQRNQGGISNVIGGAVETAADAGSFVSDVLGTAGQIDAAVKGVIRTPDGQPRGGAAIQRGINNSLDFAQNLGATMGLNETGTPFTTATSRAIGSTPGSVAAPSPGAPSLAQAMTGQGLQPLSGPQMTPAGGAAALMTGGALAQRASTIQGIGSAPMPEATAGLFTGAAAGQHAAAGSVGSAMQSVIRKTVSQNIPAAEEGGASIGAAMGGGTATGVTSTKTITDTVMRKHIKHMVDVGQSEGDIHSPSGLTRRRLGQPLGEGTALGVQDTFGMNKSAAGGLIGHYSNENTPAPVINIRGGKRPAKMAQDAAAPGAEGGMIRGQAKQVQFGEDPNAVGNKGDAARAVFDKQVMSWDAKPGVDITQIHDMGELNAAIQSPLSGRQYTALNSMQGILDQPGLTRNSQMFGERTEQNIMRNRSGAFDVAGQWANHLEDQKDQARMAGENSGQGYEQGLNSRAPFVSRAGAGVAKAGHKGLTDEDEQRSPSAKWFGFAGNSVAGYAGGVAASTGMAVDAVTAMAATVGTAVQGPLSDYGLQAGYTYVQAFTDGTSRQVKKTDYQALGEPGNLSPAAMSKLAATGLLRAGSGAFTTKTPSGAPGAVMLAPATPTKLTLNLQPQHIYLDGDHVATIADRQIELAFNQVTGTYDTL